MNLAWRQRLVGVWVAAEHGLYEATVYQVRTGWAWHALVITRGNRVQKDHHLTGIAETVDQAHQAAASAISKHLAKKPVSVGGG